MRRLDGAFGSEFRVYAGFQFAEIPPNGGTPNNPTRRQAAALQKLLSGLFQ
jgi:hypothetical protein